MLRLAWILILLISSVWKVYAIDDFQLTIDLIETDLFQVNQVIVDVRWQDSQQLSISISAESITSQYFEQLSSIRIQCNKTKYTGQQFQCPDGVMLFNYQDQKEIKTGLGFNYALNHTWQFHLDGLDIDAPYFSELLQNLHPALQDYEITNGRLHGQLELNGNAGTVTDIKFSSDLEALSLEGESILEAVGAEIELNLENSEGVWLLTAELTVNEGAMYIVPGMNVLGDRPGFFIEVGDDPLSVKLAGRWDSNKNILYLEEFIYSHPGVLELQGSAELIVAETTSLAFIKIATSIDNLEQTFPVYIQPLLLQTDFNDLEMAGKLALTINFSEQQLEQMDLNFDDIYIDDNNNRFSLSDLSGNLSLRSDAKPIQSSLSWDGMSFHRLNFGKGTVIFESVAKQVNVLSWEDVAVLDGKLEISNFNIQNIGSPDFELTIDANLTPISMTTFTQAMQWPLMSGTLSGAFSGLKYSHNNLQMNGDINIHVFDGDVELRNLYIKNIFSEYSELSADIEINGLDLEQLTDTFTFGKIEGTLNGWVNGLVLDNWQPVYFEAGLVTPEDDDKPHRISQKALNNLNSLGGGLSGTMSRGAIRFFPEYSYGQIGLSCRLNNSVCELGGVKETSGGFYLLTRGGLLPPWVEVKGTGRSIQWDHLIDGLKQISQGEVRIE